MLKAENTHIDKVKTYEKQDKDDMILLT